MPVLVRPTQTRLAWSDFEVTDETFRDGVAEAGFDSGFQPENFSPRRVRGSFYLPETFTVRVWPVARVNREADQTPELLAHEQLHFDVGIVCARALARDITGLNRRTVDDLGTALSDLQQLHMFDRADAIQQAYDTQTQHGRDADKQREWQAAMAQCLGSRTMTRLMGLPL